MTSTTASPTATGPAVALASVLLLSQGALAGDLPVQGGPGGDYFRSECSGQFAVGLHFRSGAWVDAIGLRCAGFKPKTGSFKPARDLELHGGDGGAPGVAGSCPDNAYLSGITHGYTRNGNENQFLNFVEIACTPVASGNPVRVCLETGAGCWVGRPGAPEIPIFGGTPLLTPLVQHCPPGEAAVGLHGRAGAFVDAIGLVCGPRPEPAVAGLDLLQVGGVVAADPAPAPAPTPPPDPVDPTVTVLLDVDVYENPNEKAKLLGVLAAGTPGVSLVEKCQADYWCHVKGNVPGGFGWVWSGPGYKSLQV
jgi:hypothetical protein